MTYTSNLWNYDDSKYNNNIANKDILQIGNAISSIFGNLDQNIKIEIPRLVVVGTQSSGKSSLLNGLLSMDLLPTGKTMVTRTPLNLQLNQSDNESKIEIGNYSNGMWKIEKTIYITDSDPTSSEIDEVRDEIIRITNKIAGNNKCISTQQINLRIYSKNVPNLSLIDLPGLTMVACTDKGQPKDIKDQIRKLVSSYIDSKNTIILAVMQARPDLETDVGLDLIKEYDPNGDRTLGILTKIDLMNAETDISDYLLNNVSKDLQLNYGYFAVKNKSKENLSIKESLNEEKRYFQSHNIYSKLSCQDYIGTPHLGLQLSKILINHLKKSLPNVMIQLSNHRTVMEKELRFLGTKIPQNKESKISYLHQLLSDFSKNFIDSMENRTYSLSYGKKIKDTFINYRNKLEQIEPFSASNYNDTIIIDAIQNAEGNHMSFPIPPIEVIEKCILDINNKPIRLFYEPSILCSSNIQQLLCELIELIIKEMNINRFPLLSKTIRDIIINDLLKKSVELTNSKINEMIIIEEDYIWTDEPNFLNKLYNLPENLDKQKYNINFIRNVLVTYYDTVRKNIQNNIPKVIMTFLVKYSQKSINSFLFNSITNDKVDTLLSENTEIEKKREDLINKLEVLKNARDVLDTYN